MRSLRGTLLMLLAPGLACGGTDPADTPPLAGKIVFASDRSGETRLYSMNADGTGVAAIPIALQGIASRPDVSPDGQRITFAYYGEIYVINANGTGLVNVTDHPAHDSNSRWSPDGTRIAFDSDRSGGGDIYGIGANGAGLMQMTSDPIQERMGDWSPDGTQIVFTTLDSESEILIAGIDGSSRRVLVPRGVALGGPAWSPDGSTIAFEDFEGLDIFLIDADGGNMRVLGSAERFRYNPAWSPDGSRIAFSRSGSGDSEVAVINVDGSALVELTNNAGSDRLPSWGPDIE